MKNKTILIVDDIAENIDVLATLLSKNYDIRYALSGREALAIIAKSPPDLILLDVMMPEMSGFETMMTLKLNPATQKIPVIFVTAKTDADSESGALLAGAVDYIHKPINPDVVQARISMHLKLQHQEQVINKKNKRLESYQAQQRSENKLAQEVLHRQVRLPETQAAGIFIEHWSLPATTFSGDVLSISTAPDGKIFALLADATGHGLAAAITTLPLLTVYHSMVDSGAPIRSILAVANRTLLDNLPSGRFIAVSMLCIDTAQQSIELWNGGMPEMLMLDARGEVTQRFISHGIPLGVISRSIEDFETETVHMLPGTQLIVYSDGISEARNPAAEEFGMTQFEQTLAASPAAARIQHIKEALRQHLKMPSGHDDITLMTVLCAQ